MATFVTSDAHGHLKALDRALELAAPGPDDTVYVLGDMVDRGPDPVGVLRLVHGLPRARVLLGNHEDMLLTALATGEQLDLLTWEMNGGSSTAAGLDALPRDEYLELLNWIENLPLWDVVEVGDRSYLLCHAGIDALALRGYLACAGYGPEEGFARVPLDVLRAGMEAQDPEDLLWIRGEFWSEPTGLVGRDGTGPVVIAGHTPSIYIAHYADLPDSDGVTAEGLGRIVRVGACEATGNVADRIDIDCSAAAGASQGRVGVMRLDDGEMFYATIKSGE